MVVAVDRGRFQVEMADLGEHAEPIGAVKARVLGRKGIVVGDRVEVVGVEFASPDSAARIVRRLERSTVLRRSADDEDPTERVVVANATQLAIVTAAASPEPNLELIDRAVIAADDAGIPVLIIVTKTDLAPDTAIRMAYQPLGIDVLQVRDGVPESAIRDRLTGEVTVVFGPSGVGKSTLVNALIPGALRTTGGVNVVTGKGRHTSTSVRAIALAPQGWIIDTPGVRSLGLAHVPPMGIVHAFPDLPEVLEHCPRDCGHDGDDCALLQWSLTQDVAVQARITSLCELLVAARRRATTP
jgi:ribosome biogenesis GTPase